MLPSHKQLLLPVLQTLDSLGGSALAHDVVNAVADRLQVPQQVRNARGVVSGRNVNSLLVASDGYDKTALDVNSFLPKATAAGNSQMPAIRSCKTSGQDLSSQSTKRTWGKRSGRRLKPPPE